MKSIAQILGARGGGRRRWHELAEHKLDEIDARIRDLQTARTMLEAALRCDCGHVDGCDLVADATSRRRLAPDSGRP